MAVWVEVIAIRKKKKKTKYRSCGLFRHCLYEDGLHRTVSRLSWDWESKVLRKVWVKDDSDPVGPNLCKMHKKKAEDAWFKVCSLFKNSVFDSYYMELCWWITSLQLLFSQGFLILYCIYFCFRSYLYLDSPSAPNINNNHAADLLTWEYCFLPLPKGLN